MPNDDPRVEKYFCNSCQQKTNHSIRGDFSRTEDDPIAPVSFFQQMLIVECRGCEHLSFVERTHISEDTDHVFDQDLQDWKEVGIFNETIYPPVTFRARPSWFDDLPDPTLREISQEIYTALHSSSMFLATFGARTMIDRLIVLTVGDKGNFDKGLKALMESQRLSQHERDILEPVLQAGHAAAHRGWVPTVEQFKTILDTVEGLLHRLLVLPKLAEELEEAVPKRHGKTPVAPVQALNILKKIETAPKKVRAIYDSLEKLFRAFGKDVIVSPQKHYMAFRRNRNFASVQVYNQKGTLKVYLNLDPDTVDLGRKGLRDVRQIGHYGTGNLEVSLSSETEITSFQDLFTESYKDS